MRIEVVTKRRTLLLICDTPTEAEQWMQHVEAICVFAGIFGSAVQEDPAALLDDEPPAGPEPEMRGSSDPTADSSSDDDEEAGSNGGGARAAANSTFEARRQRLESISLARKLGASGSISGKQRHLTVVYNPVSGQGLAKTVVLKTVVPILTMANVKHTIIPTQYQGHCRELVRDLDIARTDGLLICGGDGLVSEAITGLMNRTDGANAHFPMGIVPVGTANAMANDLDGGKSTTQVCSTW